MALVRLEMCISDHLMGSLLRFKVVDVPNTDPGGTSKKAKIRHTCTTNTENCTCLPHSYWY